MAKVDITGLLTGLAGTPDLEREGITRASAIQGQGAGSNLARGQALRAPQREQMMRQGAGGLFGVDTRTAGQKVKEQLGQLDITTPAGQEQAVQLVAQIDPTRALALRTQFAEQEKTLTARAAQKTAQVASRADVAKQVRQLDGGVYSAFADAINSEQGTGKDIALTKGVDLITRANKTLAGQVPKTVNLVDIETGTTKGSAIEIAGVIHSIAKDGGIGSPITAEEMVGIGVSDSYVSPRVPLINNGLTAEEVRKNTRLVAQGNMYETTTTLVPAATQNIQVANGIAGLIAKGTPMGEPAKQVASLATTIQSLASVTGLTVPADVNDATADLARMKAYAGKALMPFVEQQGKGFTDPERKYFLSEVIAGMSQPYQFNDTYATLLKSSALSDLEKNRFAYSIRSLEKLLKHPEESTWADYESKVPRLTVGQKKYGDQTFEGAIVIEDNENLSRYWATPEGSPTGFIVKDGDNGGTREMLWAELEGLVAKSKKLGEADTDTMREALAKMSRLDLIVDGVYE